MSILYKDSSGNVNSLIPDMNNIASTTTGINPSITDSADGYVQSITIYGRTDTVEGELRGIGEDGELEITTANSDNTASTTATVTTGIPLYAVGDVKDELDEKKGVVIKRCEKVVFDGSEEWTHASSPNERNSAIISTVITRVITPHRDGAKGHLISMLDNLSPSEMFVELSDNGICIGNELSAKNAYIRINGVFTADALKTYLASNPVAVVYEIAEPYEIPLASAEISALRGLKTYSPTTNVTVTAAPTVDVGYLLDTGNGQAVADVQNELQGQISNIPAWLTDIPEMHRNIFRGQSLGSSVTAAQLAAIADGSFDDLYVGDYWTINSTVYRIADMDYYLLKGTYTENYTLGTRKHHLVILPDDGMYETTYNGSQSSAGYYGSVLRSSRTTAQTAINTAFPNMMITYKECLTTNAGPSYSRSIYDCDVEAMNAYMLYGHPLWFNAVDYSNSPASCFSMRMGLKQFALFRLASEFIEASHPYWLQDQSASFVAPVIYNNPLAQQPSTTGVYNRPFFLLGDASNI